MVKVNSDQLPDSAFLFKKASCTLGDILVNVAAGKTMMTKTKTTKSKTTPTTKITKTRVTGPTVAPKLSSTRRRALVSPISTRTAKRRRKTRRRRTARRRATTRRMKSQEPSPPRQLHQKNEG
jgi:hypothetical protein